jgi:DNA polymerase III subunit delta'
MPLLPLFGHEPLRARLREVVERGTLPASLLLQGPRGVGKQRLALWIGQLLLCTGNGERPCGACTACRYAVSLTHPDLHWYFPRPRLKDADPDLEDVADDYREAIAERVKADGLYAPPSGTEGLYVATVRAIVQQAAMTPAFGARKVFVVGDAERLVPQVGSEEAANAFLKLLEEPPANTTILLTSSEPGSLLPTIRSRVVSVRVPRLADAEVERFLADARVAKAAGVKGGAGIRERASVAAGAPGALLSDAARGDAHTQAMRLLEAATGRDRAVIHATALRQGVKSARGAFSDTLDALTVILHNRARGAASRGDERQAAGAARAVEVVEEVKEMAAGNVNPQLATARLLRELEELLR